MAKYRYLREEEKRAAVARVAAGESVTTVARQIGVDRRRLYEWYNKHKGGGPEELRRVGRPSKQEALSAQARAWQGASDESAATRRRIAALERKIGEQEIDLDFFRRALRQLEEARRTTATRGGAASTKSSKR